MVGFSFFYAFTLLSNEKVDTLLIVGWHEGDVSDATPYMMDINAPSLDFKEINGQQGESTITPDQKNLKENRKIHSYRWADNLGRAYNCYCCSGDDFSKGGNKIDVLRGPPKVEK